MKSEKVRIGIPQALGYYDYHHFWEEFFAELGVELVSSGPTTKRVVDLGVAAAIDEACLPVKVFYGHVRALMERKDLGVDFIFLPRLVSVERRSFICPKFMGIPDMIRVNLAPQIPLIDTCVDMSKGPAGLRRAAVEAGGVLGVGPRQALRALGAACGVWRDGVAKAGGHRPQCRPPNQGRIRTQGCSPAGLPPRPLHLLTLGHAYNLEDPYTSLGLRGHLEELGCQVWTVDDFPPESLEEAITGLPRHLFWTSGRRILAAARHVVQHRCVDGIVHLVSFGCGPDSLVGEMVQRETLRRGGMPFLLLTIDEHSGEAGLLTRLEAFVDMVRRRQVTGMPGVHSLPDGWGSA